MEGSVMRKRLSIMVVILLIIMPAVLGSSLKVSSFEENSIQFLFSNLRFVDYNGVRSLSVDVETKVQTSFLFRDIAFGEMKLLMYSADLAREIEVHPTLFNSITLGTIVNLGISGKTIKERLEIGEEPIKAIKVDSGKTHIGTLLFQLPDTYTMITALSYNKKQGAIRQATNSYLDITADEMNINKIFNELVVTEIPTEGHMVLLDIYKKMKEFTNLNEPLKSAW